MTEKADYRCPQCKHVVRPTGMHVEKCERCDLLLVLVKVIGTDAVMKFYRRK